MSRHRGRDRVHIENPLPGGGAFTSRRAFQAAVDRGAAFWKNLAKTRGRYYDDAERVREMAVRHALQADKRYWNGVSEERGGDTVYAIVVSNGVTRKKDGLLGYAGFGLACGTRRKP